jgi:hypothetical protein
MERMATQVGPVTGAAVICCCTVYLTAWAAPPSLKSVQPSRPADSVHANIEMRHIGFSGAALTARASLAHLDLRAPESGEFSAAHSMNAVHRFSAVRGDKPDDEHYYPSLSEEASHARGMSKPEEFARRFHREGLPLARLWENHSALVSLGLNQRGKLGLWLVQKTH